MAIEEVYSDGIGSIKVVGETVRVQFVSLAAGGQPGQFEPRVRVVLPLSSLDSMIETLTRARRGVQAAAAGEGAD